MDVAEGITDEDYDLFYEIWQEFDPKGSQYIQLEHLAEFLDVLEPPLQIAKPNKYKIIMLDVPIGKITIYIIIIYLYFNKFYNTDKM